MYDPSSRHGVSPKIDETAPGVMEMLPHHAGGPLLY
jgi:hypothetical protein